MTIIAEKKQGRRSSKEAEETKREILTKAVNLFCELGYKKVSLRMISEQAGVSHSLLRYHFGSKEKIWRHLSDRIYSHFYDYFQYMVSQLPQGLAPNVQLYKLMNRMNAHTLADRRAIQFLADVVRQDEKMINYFLDPDLRSNKIIEQLVEQLKIEQPDTKITLNALRWHSTIYSHAACTLLPLLEHAYVQDEDPLLAHWQQYNDQLSHMLDVPEEFIDRPEKLEDIIIKAVTNNKFDCKS